MLDEPCPLVRLPGSCGAPITPTQKSFSFRPLGRTGTRSGGVTLPAPSSRKGYVHFLNAVPSEGVAMYVRRYLAIPGFALALIGLGASQASAGGRTVGATGVSVKDVDWKNAWYTVECPRIAPRPFNVSIANGEGHGPGDEVRPDGYRVYADTFAMGDLTGDGKPEVAVVVYCGPQQSNFGTSEVQVFTEGPRPLSRLVPPPKQAGAIWEPLINRDSFRIKDGRLIANVTYWGPNDSHAGPSIHRVLTWTWDGNGFKLNS